MKESRQSDGASVYYQHTGGVPLVSQVSLAARRRMFRLFIDSFNPSPSTSVLDVGVTSDTASAESNYFEQMYPYPHNIVCVGTEDGSHLTARYPGLRYISVTSGQPLPFRDQEFDIVFSNAVLEHVGGTDAQKAFVRELGRVAKAFFITTPNRWFPVEHHTGVPLLHHLPAPIFRALIRRTRFSYWSDEAHLNLLGAGALARLFPANMTPMIRRIKLAGFTSNLVALSGRVHKYGDVSGVEAHGPQGARSEHIGHIRATSNAAGRDGSAAETSPYLCTRPLSRISG